MSPDDPKSHSVYVLWSPAGRCFYIGLTDNVTRRLQQHNRGVSKWTKRHAGTWRLVWHHPCASLTEARKLERWLKRQKRGNGFWERTGLERHRFPTAGS